MKGKRLKYDFNPNRIPRGGPAPDVECPLQGGDFVSFVECLECEYHLDILESDLDYCLIEKQEKEERSRKEQDEIDRESAVQDARMAEDDRKMREEMAEMRDEQEKNRKKWMKEYEKQENEDKKKEEEWNEMTRKFLADLYGEETVEWLENIESDGNFNKEDDEEEEDEEDWVDW